MRCCKRYNYFQTKHQMDTTRPVLESGRQHLATGSTYLQRNCCMNPIKHEANTVQQSPAASSTASLPITMCPLQNHVGGENSTSNGHTRWSTRRVLEQARTTAHHLQQPWTSTFCKTFWKSTSYLPSLACQQHRTTNWAPRHPLDHLRTLMEEGKRGAKNVSKKIRAEN